jgi:hypothetical protein
MFLTLDDYKVVCNPDDLDIITQSSQVNRERAERVAMDEIAIFLSLRYDVAAAFAAEGDRRNDWLINATVNVALYYMVHWLPQNMAIEARRDLYDGVIARLREIQLGRGVIDLPLYSDDGSGKASGPVRFGTMPRSTYDY